MFKTDRRKTIIFFIVVIIIVLVFSLKGENVLFVVFKPIQNFFSGLSYKISSASGPVFSTRGGPAFSAGGRPASGWGWGCGELKKEKKILEIQIRAFKKEIAEMEVLKRENEILRSHLDFSQKREFKQVLTNIIGERFEAGTNWFLIDKGTSNGIERGLAVVNEGGFFVGTIIEVDKFISYFMPIYDPHSQRAADIIGKDGVGGEEGVTSGIVQGKFGLSAEMSWIPQEISISPGDMVITSGLEENIPRGLVIGEVQDVIKKPNAIFQKVIVKPMFSSEELRIVSVILPH